MVFSISQMWLVPKTADFDECNAWILPAFSVWHVLTIAEVKETLMQIWHTRWWLRVHFACTIRFVAFLSKYVTSLSIQVNSCLQVYTKSERFHKISLFQRHVHVRHNARLQSLQVLLKTWKGLSRYIRSLLDRPYMLTWIQKKMLLHWNFVIKCKLYI